MLLFSSSPADLDEEEDCGWRWPSEADRVEAGAENGEEEKDKGVVVDGNECASVVDSMIFSPLPPDEVILSVSISMLNGLFENGSTCRGC